MHFDNPTLLLGSQCSHHTARNSQVSWLWSCQSIFHPQERSSEQVSHWILCIWLRVTVFRYTNRVVTLWYRPPELLLGERNYGPPVDMWGAGCIMAEMWTRSPIMQGNTEQHQLTLIAQLCGAIQPDVWPGVEQLDLYSKMEIPKIQKRRVKERLKPYVKDQWAVDLLDKLLTLNPAVRIDSDIALNHDFFWTAWKECCHSTHRGCLSFWHPSGEAELTTQEEVQVQVSLEDHIIINPNQVDHNLKMVMLTESSSPKPKKKLSKSKFLVIFSHIQYK